jgi:FkbM family methyltransferase
MSAADTNFNRLKDTRYGRMLYNIHDVYIGRSYDVYGEYSEHEISLLLRLVRPGITVVDVGANIGTHTIPFAKAVGDAGAVVAFEPQRLVFQILCANVALNSLANVRAFQYAVGEEQDTIAVPQLDFSQPHNLGGVELGSHAAGEQVAMIRLDDMELPVCHLLKIDVEGMELSVLKGGKELIERCKPVLYVENDRKEKSDELIRYIASIGYRIYWHRPLLFNRQNFFQQSEDLFPNIASHNVLCVSGEAKVEGLEEVTVP